MRGEENHMSRAVRTGLPALVVAGCLSLAWPLTAAAPTARPEEVGLSAQRLTRVTELVERHIAAGSFSGAVTLVARHGRIAHHEAHGLMDLDTTRRREAAAKTAS
jgi:CubicO group peptidase (beta-lactamase class C family)